MHPTAQSTPLFTPDGMIATPDRTAPAARAATQTRQPLDHRLEAIVAHERQDDGLVHAHRWARSTD